MATSITDRYQFISYIDPGGMGEVIKCQDAHLQRPVVLKKLNNNVESRRLLDEQKALAKLRSKHVVQLFDVISFTDDGKVTPAIILEFIDGKLLEPNSFTADTKYLHAIWQIACGLTDIHAKGIIHRDIKPNNIKIDPEGVIKILDFGLSKASDKAVTRSVIGTPIFMAPELWSDETISFNDAVDVYAYGMTCLALLTDAAPMLIQTFPPPPISKSKYCSFFSPLPDELSSLLHRCVSLTPNERPRMKEVKALLERYLLRNRHKATVVLHNNTHILDSDNRRIKLNARVGSLTIEYDGLDFIVTDFSGDVSINNTAIKTGMRVPGCSVLTFGNGRSRDFVTFDISNPEVMP